LNINAATWSPYWSSVAIRRAPPGAQQPEDTQPEVQQERSGLSKITYERSLRTGSAQGAGGKREMEGQRERTSSRRRQRRKAKNARGKITVEPVLIAARRPDSPLLKNGFHNAIASAEPKRSRRSSVYLTDVFSAAAMGPPSDGRNDVAQERSEDDDLDEGGLDAESTEARSVGAVSNGSVSNGSVANGAVTNGAGSHGSEGELDADKATNGSARVEVRRRAVRIVKAAEHTAAPDNREQRLIERLMRSQGRVAISRAADDLWESKFIAPRLQEVQIQLLEHENEHRARDAVFIMAELLQRESPVQRPILDQRLRRLEEFAEDPITRDAARALRRSMRVHHGI
jgi:hypothetical protein